MFCQVEQELFYLFLVAILTPRDSTMTSSQITTNWWGRSPTSPRSSPSNSSSSSPNWSPWWGSNDQLYIQFSLQPWTCRTWRTRSWRPTCGWSSTGETTSSSGIPRSTAGSTCSTSLLTTSGDLTSSSTTSKGRFQKYLLCKLGDFSIRLCPHPPT